MRLIRKPEACRKLGMTESTFDDKRKSDPRFPRPVALGARAIAFVESELDDYIAKLPRVGADGSPSCTGRAGSSSAHRV